MQSDDQAPLVTRVERPATAGPSVTGPPSGLPEDLLRDAAKRLRFVALIYAAGVVVAELSVALLDSVQREQYLHFYGWGPGTISVSIAFAVAAVAGSRRVSLQMIMNIGVLFEIVAAYSIAIATYWGVYRGLAYEPEHLTIIGLSFVAPWIMFYTIVIPNPPKKALLAATLAATSVPVALVLSARYGGSTIRLDPGGWITVVVVPYALIVITAWIGARVVFKLGTAVRQAREMGSYRLVEQLGHGGMGEVWRAKHRMLARPAAIKLVRPDMIGEIDGEHRQRTLRRFEREAQTTALMRSPHTIELYDFGVTSEGTFYYVMELLDGFDLETLVQRFGPLPAGRAIHLLIQVCDSLAEAHQSALIHRDIKPANIYVCRYGLRADFVKVLDFGLVKVRMGGLSDDSDEMKLTAAQNIAGGTPAYMAPEQAIGEAIDGRADIYALGCVAYWLVTGQMVFQARSTMEMIARHVRTPPVAPSERSELEIPEALDRVILACLEKDRNLRPQSAEELSRLLAGCNVESPWTAERAQEWWDLHQPSVSRISEAERRLEPA
jgi:serine/threonine-protein kinase